MKNRSKITLLLIAIFIVIGLSACAAAGTGDAVPTTTAPPADTLTQSQAEAIALEHAGLTADQVTGLHSEKDWDDGVLEYEIEFRHGDYEYDYTIHAETGTVLDWDKEYDPKPTATPTDPTEDTLAPTVPTSTTGPMLQSEAEDIALAHAGFTADQVTNLRAELDDDWEYEVEFRQGDYEYDYTIDAVTGQILDWDKDYDPKPPAPTTTPTEPSVSVDAPTAEKLTEAEAQAIALAHAGLTADQVTGLRTDKDWDDGVPEYEIEFRHGDYEYDYTIHAETGTVLDWDKEYDPKPTAPTENTVAPTAPTEPSVSVDAPTAERLTEADAQAIALAHAGLTQATDLEIEYDVDDGIPTYEVEFEDGEWEYTYEIHAKTGEILDWEKERR